MQDPRSISALRAYVGAEARRPLAASASHGDSPPLAPIVRPFVTLSRQCGTGGLRIASELARQLGDPAERATSAHPWTYFDKDLVSKVLADHDLPRDIERFLREERVSEIDNLIGDLFGLHPSVHRLVTKASQTILQLASVGHVVLVGRASNIVTSGLPGGLHVRMVGSRPRRIERIRESIEKDARRAEKLIDETDRARRDYMRQHFGRDIEDAVLYDLVVRTDALEPVDVAKLIRHALEAKVSRVRGAVQPST